MTALDSSTPTPSGSGIIPNSFDESTSQSIDRFSPPPSSSKKKSRSPSRSRSRSSSGSRSHSRSHHSDDSRSPSPPPQAKTSIVMGLTSSRGRPISRSLSRDSSAQSTPEKPVVKAKEPEPVAASGALSMR